MSGFHVEAGKYSRLQYLLQQYPEGQLCFVVDKVFKSFRILDNLYPLDINKENCIFL